MGRIVAFIMSFVVFMMMSCSNEVETQNTGSKVDERYAEYEQKFMSHFGTVSETQDWGFGIPSETRASDINGSVWYQDWERPVNVTEEEKTRVIAEFSKERRDEANSISITWTNYWIQQVYRGEEVYADGNWQYIGTGSSHMEYLIAYNDNKVEETYWPSHEIVYGGYEQIPGFSYGDNQTECTDKENGYTYIGTALMMSMGTDGRAEQFGYHNPIDGKDHYEYIILEIDGSYYIGFDFYSHGTDLNPNNRHADIARDWIYNDWIVKVSPAMPRGWKPEIQYEKRIICEDLSDPDDFDFNDVVFDALIDYEAGKTYIKILAAGTPVLIKVAGISVHQEAFGVDDKVLVNTGVVTKPSKEFVIDRAYRSYADIPVDIEDSKTRPLIRYDLKHSVGKAAHKICVGTDYKWCTEHLRIDEMYPTFRDYVHNPNIGNEWYQGPHTY